MISTKEEVEHFLKEIRRRLNETYDNLILLGRTISEDKTTNFLIENNITRKHICDELLKLDITNYSYTDYDDNKNWSSEKIWIFGQMFFGIEFNCCEEIYIKLKLRKRVICMSFHPIERELIYPYL